MRTTRLILLAGLVSALLPAAAAAQSTIAGVVRDSSGGVLPGVTVEAASPALIEKVRSATTDGNGQYRIVDLRPGIYSVTFSLTGFNTVKREGVELPSNFTVPISIDMKVGSLEETITVTGDTPLVDIQSATQQQALKRDVLDAIPNGRNMPAVGKLLPGIVSQMEVGGSEGMQTPGMSVHGSSQTNYQIDGMTLQSPIGNGTAAMYWNDGQFQELSFQTSGIPAEVALGGVRASTDGLDTLLERRAAGTLVTVHAFRRDELMTFDVELAPAPLDTAALTVNDAASAAAALRRATWLGVAAPANVAPKA